MFSPTEVATSQEPLSDEEVVTRVLAGETGMFEIIMRRHNQRLYHVARAILRNDGEAEDVMQDAYVRAYEHLDQFAAKAKFSTWLTRIAVHEALSRQRRGNRYQELEPMSERERDPMDRFASWRRIRNSKRQTRRFADCWKKRLKSCRTLTGPSSYSSTSRT